MSSPFGRVVLLSADAMPLLVALAEQLTELVPASVRVYRGASYQMQCAKTVEPSVADISLTAPNKTTWEVELFRNGLAPIVESFWSSRD